MGERKKVVVAKLEFGNYKTAAIPETVIDLCDSPLSEHDESPLRPILCVKTREKMREIEKTEDCCILDFDPFDLDDISNHSITKRLANLDTSSDLSVISEKGQVACRDYPHSRHCCVKYPFGETPHESFCKMCYCFVCDLEAPCKSWTGQSGHCHAIDSEAWKSERTTVRELSLFKTAG